jgi:hypothetical protein
MSPRYDERRLHRDVPTGVVVMAHTHVQRRRARWTAMLNGSARSVAA